MGWEAINSRYSTGVISLKNTGVIFYKYPILVPFFIHLWDYCNSLKYVSARYSACKIL